LAREPGPARLRRGLEIELDVTALAAGGDGVGRAEAGQVVFVPGAAPGDRVRVAIREDHRSYARGELREIVIASPVRVIPPCPDFAAGRCGGCQWLHVAGEAQVAAKEELVRAALRHSIAAGMRLLPVETPVPPLGWRRRARLHWVRPPAAPRALIGLFAPRSHRVTEVSACVQLEPALLALLPLLRAQLGPGLQGRGCIELVLGLAGRIHVAVDGRCRPAVAAALVGVAGIAGVTAAGRQFGEPAIEIEPGLVASAAHFAQAARTGNEALVAAVLNAAAAAPGRRVLELFAGTGNFTRALAATGAEVVAVEVAPPPPAALAPGGPLAGVEWRVGDSAAVAGALAGTGQRFDVVVLDPPRTGARALMTAVAALAPARVVYVSCDAATLARDLEVLRDAGYLAREALPLDLMPQTSHVEVVVTLERPM
jgi:23S rRNA (uracil1939-C5)-methyltransferase